MRRVLIVTSSYAPTMIADMQRVRQLAWELPKLDWEVEVLSSVDRLSTCNMRRRGQRRIFLALFSCT